MSVMASSSSTARKPSSSISLSLSQTSTHPTVSSDNSTPRTPSSSRLAPSSISTTPSTIKRLPPHTSRSVHGTTSASLKVPVKDHFAENECKTARKPIRILVSAQATATAASVHVKPPVAAQSSTLTRCWFIPALSNCMYKLTPWQSPSSSRKVNYHPECQQYNPS